MKSTQAPNEPYLPRAAAPVASEGYLGSSLDLRAGLWIRELMVSACPPEVIHELARMRRSWPAPAAL